MEGEREGERGREGHRGFRAGLRFQRFIGRSTKFTNRACKVHMVSLERF